jgi:hypothetical protein
MTLTTRATVVCQYMIDNILKPSPIFAAADVYYGDSDLIPRVPSVTVEPGNKGREFTGTGLRADIAFEVVLMVYLCSAEADHQDQLSADELAEDVEALINADTTMGGLVVNGFVDGVEQGFALRQNEVLKAARLTWQGRSRHRLGA